MPTDVKMAETNAIRVVPSGKVYRQMFDAQVQLNKSLSNVQRKDKLPRLPQRDSFNKTVPVVHLAQEETQHGILGGRQKTWVESFPNEPHVENPVLYKQFTEFVNARQKETDGSVASKEVRGLPDVVVPAKEQSDIIDRIYAGRRERHEAAVEDMHQELSVINAELEPRVAEVCEMTLDQLGADDQEIAALLTAIKKNEVLLTFSLEDLFKLWEDIEKHTPERQSWISQLDERLQQIEDDRMDMITKTFKSYAKLFEDTAHLMAPDLHRFLDTESQTINQTLLTNKRAYADLFHRLMSSDVEREKKQHTMWRRRVEDWKKLNTEHAVLKFKEFMNSEAVTKPPEVEKVYDFMVTEQGIGNAKRQELIESMGEMKPPASTKTAVYKWNQQLLSVTQEIDAVNQLHMSKLHAVYEMVCQNCLDKVETIKKSLIASGACDENKAKDIVETKMLPLVGDRQRILEGNLETMESDMELHTIKMEDRMKSLFKFTQGVAHVWDVHEIGLAKQERALQERLEACRHQHDNMNQEREANLDIVMDRMRQDASEQNLRDSLAKALEMLERIRLSYEIFHDQQTGIVKSYPEQVKTELDGYDEGILKFFGLDRTMPEKKPRKSLVKKDDDSEKEGSDTETSTTSKGLHTPRTPKKKKSAKKERSQHEEKSSSKPLPHAMSEVLRTERGTSFYVLTVAGEHGIPKDGSSSGSAPATPTRPVIPAFMTEVETPDDNKPEYLMSVDIPVSLLIEVRKKIRMNFLNHLEEWIIQATERASCVVVAKCEELNSELDLRLHLHQPRARRAEFDIHNVRAAELVMHSERVARHCKGIQQSLTDLRHRFNAMSNEHNKLAQKFREDIEALEVIFISATKSSRLVALQNQLSVELEKFMSVIRTSLRQFRQQLDETLQMLRESNARFIKSFKLFSDGGNFCPDEIEEYRKRLEKMSQKIDAAEGSIMADLEGMESRRLEQATKVAMEFEDRFKSHMFDLLFMERIARWLTNTQVKIKAEVANSNSQAQRLMQHLNDLVRRIDACEKPNLDKEQITSSRLNECLADLFDAFHDRSVYLKCVKDDRPVVETIPVNPATRVGFVNDFLTVSKPGKQPSEDPSVGMIKSILKGQVSKMRFGMDAEFDGETPSSLLIPPPSASCVSHDTSKEKQKSSLSSASHKGSNPSDKHPGSRRGTLGSIVLDQIIASKRTHSALRRSSKATKFDKKYLVFGEKDEDIDTSNLVGIVKHTLREALDGLLTTAELYYRQKGNRAVTRPQALQETFELCAETLVQKLQSYYKQTQEYHNQCLQEFRGQLQELERSVASVPGLVVHDIVKEEIQEAGLAHTQKQKSFQHRLQSITHRQEEHKNHLRPALGHPHKVEALQALCEKEAARHAEYIAVVDEQTKDLQECAVEHARQFIERLALTAKNQLLQYDSLLVVDDVDKGKVEPVRHPTTELVRRKIANQPLFDTEDKNALPRGKGIWPGLINNELVIGEKSSTVEKTASVNTKKTTLGHSSTVTARDQAYEEYKAKFKQTLEQIEANRQRLLKDEQRWVDSWNMSVEKVKQLY